MLIYWQHGKKIFRHNEYEEKKPYGAILGSLQGQEKPYARSHLMRTIFTETHTWRR